MSYNYHFTEEDVKRNDPRIVGTATVQNFLKELAQCLGVDWTHPKLPGPPPNNDDIWPDSFNTCG
jgi:hypothetical protein